MSPYRFRLRVERDGRGHLEWLSPELQGLHGYSPDEVRFHNRWKRFIPTEYRQTADDFNRHVRQGQPWSGASALRAKSGTELFLEIVTEVQILPAGGHLVHGRVRDLTEETELRKAFQEHLERLRALHCDLRSLEARIEILSRDLTSARSADAARHRPAKEILEFDDLKIDVAAAEVTVRGQVVQLTPIEFKLLVELARNPGRVLSHQVLLRTVWGYEFQGAGASAPMAINRLRRKVERDPSSPTLITTVRGIGYRFDPEGA